MIQHLVGLCTLVATLSTMGCVLVYPEPTQPLTLSPVIELPPALEETSGLFCSDNSLYTLNDSGNDASVFALSYSGQMQSTLSLNLTNNDWEAITGDDDFLYVADVGNNKGKRQQVHVHRVSRGNKDDIKTYTLTYLGNEPQSNMAYAHDYDSEAMLAHNGELLLFSKSWRTGVGKVYKLGNDVNQTLSPFAEITGLPGVITGVDFDSTRSLYVVVGYKSDPFGNFSTFMAQLDSAFQPINIWPLEKYKQVEGVCVDAAGDYWFSEEATEGRKASLTRARLP